MKLECAVVRDLYVLYKENELSGEVKDSVGEHLKECSECRRVYEDGTDFQDIIKKDTDEQPSRKMDEKLMLKLKIKRLKIGVIFIAVIFAFYLYSSYVQSRMSLLYDVSRLESSLNDLYNYLGFEIYNDAPYQDIMRDIETVNNENSVITRDLNLIEKNALKKSPNGLFLNISLNKTLRILKARYKEGALTARDEQVFTKLQGFMNETFILANNEHHSLSRLMDGFGKIPALFDNIDAAGLSKGYDAINRLSLIYSQYNRLPDEVSPMTKADIENRLKAVFDLKDADISISPYMEGSIALNGDCQFDIRDGDFYYNGYMDVYTGILQNITGGRTKNDSKAELLPLESVETGVRNFLGRQYGSGFTFDIKYLGINYNFSSNTDMKVYSFKVYPLINGLRVNIPVFLHYNARDGYIVSMPGASYYYPAPDYSVDTAVKVKAEGSISKLLPEIRDAGDYKYSGTYIIMSMLSGKYTLVHAYEKDVSKIYINASTGKQEFTYEQ
jgi:hypothetical protein